MAVVLKEMAVVIGSYQDRNTGQQKNRYKNIGVLMEGESHGERYQYLLLEKSFNPAGVPSKPDSDKIIVNLFEPREGNGSSQSQQAQPASNQTRSQPAPIDDDVPFIMEWRG